MLREGRKTTAPVARVTADALRAEIVREKEGRGYVQKRVTAPTAAANGHALPPKGAPKPRRPRAIASAHKAAVAIPVNRSGRTVISF
jgi:hypothetical protein